MLTASHTLYAGTHPPDPCSSLQLPTASSEPPTPTTLGSPPAHTVSVGTHPPEPASTSLATSSISPTNTAATLTCSTNTHTLLARDKPSSSTSASQPLPCPTQLFNPSPTTLPDTQAFLRDHHCSQSQSFSPRKLRSDTSRKIFRSIRY